MFHRYFFVFGGFFVGNVVDRKTYGPQLYRQFIVDRLARLYPLHIATLAFYFILAVAIVLDLVHPKNPDRYDLLSFAPHLTLTHSWGFGEFATYNYPSWAVSAIFGCCLALPALRILRRLPSLNLALLVILAAALAICSHIATELDSSITAIQEESLGILRCVPSFLFGVLLSRNRDVQIPRGVAIATFLLAAFMLFCRGAAVHGIERLLLVYILVFSVVVIDSSGIKTPLHMSALRRIAKYSFGIYLIHSIVATILFQVLSPKLVGMQNIAFGDANSLGAMLLVIGGLIITLALAVGSSRTVELYGAHAVRAALGPKKATVAARS